MIGLRLVSIFIVASILCHAHGGLKEWSKGLLGQWHYKTRVQDRPKPEQFAQIVSDEPGASLNVSSTIFANGDTVVVTWSGISNPSQKDWVAAYSPIDAEVHSYLDWQYVSTSSSWSAGTGSVSFRLINTRRPYVFRYVRDGILYSVAATSPIVAPANVNEPTQGHIALTGDNTQMRVMWVSADPASVPTVRFGLSATGLTQSAIGSSHTYQASDMCHFPATLEGPLNFINPGYMHDVLLTGLTPDTDYFYQYGNDLHGFSSVASFHTAPAVGPFDRPFKFVAYGDMGEEKTPGAVGTTHRVRERLNETDLILHVGDLSYAWGVGFVWETFFDLIQPAASTKPYMINIGNHEYDHVSGGQNDPSGAPGNGFQPSWGNYGGDSFGECAVPPYHRFHMPDNGNSVFWYSFDYLNTHFIMISTEHNFTAGAPLYEWLQQDLASVDRKQTPWIVLGGHRPMYCSENYDGDYKVAEGMQAAFEDLLFKYQVDLAIWGHYHSYERTCAVYKNQCLDGGVVHVVAGMAGASLDSATYKTVPWSVYHDQAFGYTMVTVHNTTALQFQYFHNDDNKVYDEFWLSK